MAVRVDPTRRDRPTIVSRLVVRRRREDPLSGLMEREREVLALQAEGLSNLAIANRLRHRADRRGPHQTNREAEARGRLRLQPKSARRVSVPPRHNQRRRCALTRPRPAGQGHRRRRPGHGRQPGAGDPLRGRACRAAAWAGDRESGGAAHRRNRAARRRRRRHRCAHCCAGAGGGWTREILSPGSCTVWCRPRHRPAGSRTALAEGRPRRVAAAGGGGPSPDRRSAAHHRSR